jgi:hypothetical protein
MTRPPGPHSSRLGRWTTKVLLALISGTLLVMMVPAIRAVTLRTLGGLLIVSDPIEPVDIAAVTIESGEAGELEVSDLYHDHVMPRVLVLAPEPTMVDRELARRGVHLADQDRILSALVQLGVPRDAILMIEASEGGTTDTTTALGAWVTSHPCRVLMIVSPSHARRYRRTLQRVWPTQVPLARVRSPRASLFHAQDWWDQRRTRRDGLFELEKLAWDYLLHPL